MLRLFFVLVVLMLIKTSRQREITPSIPNHREDVLREAVDIHSQALEIAMGGYVNDALPYFRAAVRLVPGNPDYQSDLGVTEMRLGLFSKALGRFLNALKLDPYHKNTLLNIEELGNYYPEVRSKYPIEAQGKLANQHPERPKDTFAPIPRIAWSELHRRENYDYLHGLRPYILDGSTERGHARGGWNSSFFSPTSLEVEFADATVDFYPQNMRDKGGATPFFLPLKKALQQLRRPNMVFPPHIDASEPGSYIQWNMPLPAWDRALASLGPLPDHFRPRPAWMQECLSSPQLRSLLALKTHWFMLLVGERGAGMFLHQDSLRTAAWQVQVSGGKRWLLCAPTEANKRVIGRAGEVDGFAPPDDGNSNGAGDGAAPKKNLKSADCQEGTVYAGDAIYYPADWWHQTLNVGAAEPPPVDEQGGPSSDGAGVSVALSATVVDWSNFDRVMGALRKECSDPGAATIFVSAELCGSVGVMTTAAGDADADADADADTQHVQLDVNKGVGGRGDKGGGSLELCFNWWMKHMGAEWQWRRGDSSSPGVAVCPRATNYYF